jgi:hypothetical protein
MVISQQQRFDLFNVLARFLQPVQYGLLLDPFDPLNGG